MGFSVIFGFLVFIWGAFCFGASQINSPTSPPKKRYVVKYKTTKVSQGNNSDSLSITDRKVVEFNSLKEAQEEVQKLRNQPGVEYIEEDKILNAFSDPETNDPLYDEQWSFYDPLGGINLPLGWEITTGSQDVVVAVLDTGVLNHPDLRGRTLGGYDFISDSFFGNDGDGRDSDPTDTGDWVDVGDFCYSGSFRPSTWHGTHTAGTVGAQANNSLGVTGVDFRAKILPVRVLGKCGGYASDIADGIRWAAGIDVPGAPSNPNPADVINLSLGGRGNCSQFMQDAINDAVKKGAIVIAASGNQNNNIDFTPYSPASCNNVVVVSATNLRRDKSFYSNFGNRVDLSAPGGEGALGIISTSNDGVMGSASHSYRFMTGTSMAAPHVSGVAALMKAANPGLYPDQVSYLLRETSQSFSRSSTCYGICGAGLLDAENAIYEAKMTVPDETFEDNRPISQSPGGESENINFNPNEDDAPLSCGSLGPLYKNDSGGPGGVGVLNLTLGVILSFLIFLPYFRIYKAFKRYLVVGV